MWDNPAANATIIKHGRGRPYKEDDYVRDPHSTGRKRAGKLFPIDKEAPCEWQRKKNCGGGKNPIVGCLNGLQVQVHHGPNKDTLCNEPGNVHRICNTCHNRWHYFNDSSSEYDPSILHSPTDAELKEILQNEMDWKAGKFRQLTSKRWRELNDK
jgi:hypothetical protein